MRVRTHPDWTLEWRQPWPHEAGRRSLLDLGDKRSRLGARPVSLRLGAVLEMESRPFLGGSQMTGTRRRGLDEPLTEDHLILIVVTMLTAVNILLSIVSLGGIPFALSELI
jgi:hypothetical protein